MHVYTYTYIYIYIYIYTYIYIWYSFTTEGFLDVAIERWPESDLNARPLNSVQMLWPTELSGQKFNSHSEQTLYSYSNFIVCSVSHFISAIAFVSRHVYLNWKFLVVITCIYIYKCIYIYIYIYISIYVHMYLYIYMYIVFPLTLIFELLIFFFFFFFFAVINFYVLEFNKSVKSFDKNEFKNLN